MVDKRKAGEMNDTYRLTKQTSGINTLDRTMVSIPAGSRITVMGSSATDARFTDVIWEEHRLRIFAVDLQEGGEKEGGERIQVRRFNAAGREL